MTTLGDRRTPSDPAGGPAAAAPRTPNTAADAVRVGGLAQLGLMIGPLLTMVDSGIVNVAVADIASQLHASLDRVQWVVSGYLLALAAGLAASAFLARRFGTLRVYTASLIGFIIASALCAAAPNVTVLIAARTVQGLVGAPLVPLAMSLLLAKQGTGRRIPVAAGLLFFLGPALGPTLGGLLIAAGGWPLIFLVNVPVGVAGLLGLRRVPAAAAPARDPQARFDPVGLVLLALGLTLALYGASRATITGWGSPPAVLALGAGLVLLAAYTGWALRRPQPAVDLTLLRYGQPALALALSVLSSVVAFAAVFLLPVFTQTVQHHSALATGPALLPQGVITGLGTALGQRLATQITVRTLVTAGFVVLAATSAGLLLVTTTTPLWVTATILSGRAVAIGFGITPLLFAMLQPLTDAQLADGNTVFNIAQRLGGSLGVSLLASLFAARALVAGPVASFHEIGLVLTAVALGAAVLSLRLAPIRQPAPQPSTNEPAARADCSRDLGDPSSACCAPPSPRWRTRASSRTRDKQRRSASQRSGNPSSVMRRRDAIGDSREEAVGLATIELTRFRVRPENTSALLAARPRMLAEFRADRGGFIDARLVRLPDGQWLDIVAWRRDPDFGKERNGNAC